MTAKDQGSWKELIREMGESVVALLQAETRALAADLGKSGRALALAMGLMTLGGMLLFWALGVFTAALVALAGKWLSLLASTLLVTAIWAVGAAAVILAGWLRLKKWKTNDTPLLAVERRFQDHVQWWEGRVLPPPTDSSDSGTGQEDES